MSVNLLEAVQQTLGYPVLQKIDPNTQEVAEDAGVNLNERFGQAAIPAVLIALYNYSTLDEGADAILNKTPEFEWTDNIFGDHKFEAIQKIGVYAGLDVDASKHKTEEVAEASVQIIRDHLKSDAKLLEVKTLLADQRNIVLHYLPASMQMGTVLNNNTLDDRTNKMEGPVSNLMHAIGNIFSSSDSDEKK